MKHEWLQIYEAMQQDIALCQQKQMDKKTEIECCFHISQNYWAKIEKDIENYCFLSEQEEIEFYKEIKPLFKSSIRYYNYLYHAELFKPLENPTEASDFWIREKQRIEKFIAEHKDFYDYYKNERTDQDREYFIARFSLARYDELIAKLMALERYTEDIKKHKHV
jgi:RteC protein